MRPRVCSVRICWCERASQSTISLQCPKTNTSPSPPLSSSPTTPGSSKGDGEEPATAKAKHGGEYTCGGDEMGGGEMTAATNHAPLLCEPHRMTVPSRLQSSYFRIIMKQNGTLQSRSHVTYLTLATHALLPPGTCQFTGRGRRKVTASWRKREAKCSRDARNI